MSRKKRFIYSLGSITSLSLPLAFISAGEDGSSNQPSSTENSNEFDNSTVEQPKDYDPSFSTFKNFTTQRLNEALTKMPDVVIGAIKNEILKLKNDDKIEYRKSLSKQIYLYALLDFFEANKDDIKQNPDKYGFYITFPNVVSKLRLYDRGSVEYNGKIYDNVIFGAKSVTDVDAKYERVVSNPGADIKVQTSNEKNFTDRDFFEKTIRKYTDELLKRSMEISFNESDVLLLDKDIELRHEKITKDTVTFNGFSVTTPKGFDSWNSYIVAKIKPRFVDFDLTQNQEFVPEQQKQQEQTSPPNVPPLVPNDNAPSEPEVVPPNTIAEAIPSLVPFVRAEHANKSLAELNALAISKAKGVFFFNNPINTRFEYEVEAVQNGQAKVAVFEKSKPNLKRVYNVEFNLTNNNDPILQKIRYTNIESIKNAVLRFYESLGLDENIEYKKLSDSVLANTFFGMVDLFVKSIYSDIFVNDQEKEIENWRQKINNVTDEKSFKAVAKQARLMFISFISATRFNDSKTWVAIPKAYDTFVQRYQVDVFRLNKKMIIKNLDLMNKEFKSKLNNNTDYTIATIDKFFNKTTRDVSLLKANAESKPRNLDAWYNQYLNQVSDVRKNFAILRTLANSVEVTDSNYQEYDAAYQEALKQNGERKAKVENIKKQLGISTLVLGSLIFALFIILISLNIKTIKQKKLRNVYITLLGIALSVMIAGVLLMLI
ncbi:MSC_0620 family F1-like ATPase-associated subunit [Mycoplasma sp. HS2188]|uniref:MSC_0620 family F1-like ATPase-associated subunit n=1 Tax=Mycoplasma sp. HS2188 TaxID=2976765 RepID=UPI0021A9CA53|nr:hypothetical protein [Mycoplasma sp. HS2188]MCT4469643.1 hypothetical protein [Mycoplasma sp. HS2188]